MLGYFLQETKYGTPAVCLGAPESKKDSVTKVKQDNAGHMHTNTMPHTPTGTNTHAHRNTVHARRRETKEKRSIGGFGYC